MVEADKALHFLVQESLWCVLVVNAYWNINTIFWFLLENGSSSCSFLAFQVFGLLLPLPCKITNRWSAPPGKWDSLLVCDHQKWVWVCDHLEYAIAAVTIELREGITNNVRQAAAAGMLELFPVLNLFSCCDVLRTNAGAGTSTASPRRRH